ncbi:hypothetical protein BH09VER1_BH09VER1_51130 [soil metagenome]
MMGHNSVMVPICPLCNRVILADDFNVAKDLAFCRGCNASYSFADLTRSAELEAGINVQSPPTGTWYRNEASEVIFGGSFRSLPAALGTLAVALFWNGIVSVFVCGAISGTLHLMGVATPAWFFEPKVNGHIMRRWDVIGMWLFLTPFILVGLGMLCALLMRIFGKV